MKATERAISYDSASGERDRFPTCKEMSEFSRAVDKYFERRYSKKTEFSWGYQKITKLKAKDGGEAKNKSESESESESEGKGEGQS